LGTRDGQKAAAERVPFAGAGAVDQDFTKGSLIEAAVVGVSWLQGRLEEEVVEDGQQSDWSWNQCLQDGLPERGSPQ